MKKRFAMEGEVFTVLVVEETKEGSHVLSSSSSRRHRTVNPYTTKETPYTTDDRAVALPGGKNQTFMSHSATAAVCNLPRVGKTAETIPMEMDMDVEKTETEEDLEAFYGMIEIENNPVTLQTDRFGKETVIIKSEELSDVEETEVERHDIACQTDAYLFNPEEHGTNIQTDIDYGTLNASDVDEPEVTNHQIQTVSRRKQYYQRGKKKGKMSQQNNMRKKIGPKKYMETLKAVNNRTLESNTTNQASTESVEPSNDTNEKDERKKQKKHKTKQKFTAWDIFMELHSPKWQPIIKLSRVSLPARSAPPVGLTLEAPSSYISALPGRHSSETPSFDTPVPPGGDVSMFSDCEDDCDQVSIPEVPSDDNLGPELPGNPDNPADGESEEEDGEIHWERHPSVHPACRRSSFRVALERLHEDTGKNTAHDASDVQANRTSVIHTSTNKPHNKTDTLPDKDLDDMGFEDIANNNISDADNNNIDDTTGGAEDDVNSRDGISSIEAIDDNQSEYSAEDNNLSENDITEQVTYYRCKQCKKKFYTQEFLQKHLKKYNFHRTRRPKRHVKTTQEPTVVVDLISHTADSATNDPGLESETSVSVSNTPDSPVTEPPGSNRTDGSITSHKVKRLRFNKSASSSYVRVESMSSTIGEDASSTTKPEESSHVPEADDELPDLIVTGYKPAPKTQPLTKKSTVRKGVTFKDTGTHAATVQNSAVKNTARKTVTTSSEKVDAKVKAANSSSQARIQRPTPVTLKKSATVQITRLPPNYQSLSTKSVETITKATKVNVSPPQAPIHTPSKLFNKDPIFAFHCPDCPAGFNDIWRLKRHITEVHLNIRPYVCKKCDESFKRNRNLRIHIDEMHSRHRPRYPCEKCGTVFQRAEYLRRHMIAAHGKQKKHQCNVCFKRFTQLTHLRTHQKHIHEMPTLYTCDRCQASFRTRFELSLHKSEHIIGEDRHSSDTEARSQSQNKENKTSQRRPIPKPVARLSNYCKKCTRGFPSQTELDKHMKLHSEKNGVTKKVFHCDQCPKIYKHKCSRDSHQRLHDNLNAHKCSVCKRGFINNSALQKHRAIHTDRRPYDCPHCPRKFRQRSNLTAHLTIHTGEKPHRCDVCGEGFRLLVLLRAHEIRLGHGEPSPYRCEVCNSTFTRPFNLKQHMRRHTGERPFVCSICTRPFATSSGLSNHMRVHSDDRPYACEHCDKAYKTGEMLRAHSRKHTGERPFKCGECLAAFRTNSELHAHKVVHTKDKPHKCDRCGKGFAGRSALVKHRRSHDGLKPHGCEVCGLSFNGADRLKAHSIRHTGEKPYKCPHCSKCFSSNSSLYTHKKIHSGIKDHVCTECGKGFYTMASIRRHMLMHTGENPFKCDCGKEYRHRESLTNHRNKHCELTHTN